MSIIHKKREEIIKNNNIAQRQFEDILSSLKSTSTNELNVSMSLSGDIDLAVLEKKHDNIKKITFSSGDITSLRNIPNYLTELNVSKNLLTEMENIPKDIVELNISHNYLQNLDVSNATKLEILYCYNNKLEDIVFADNNNIQELYCENNDIRLLDIKKMPNLLFLNISNNNLIVLNNIDLTVNLRVFKSENTPLVNLSENIEVEDEKKEKKAIEQEVDYIFALNNFFKLKKQYEQNNLAQRRKLKPEQRRFFKPTCLKCKKKCGTIFSMKNNKYLAKCGSNDDSCNFHIELYRGEFLPLEYFLKIMKETLEEHKEDIIKQKLDTLLSYISEEQSSKLFKEKIEAYNDDNIIYMETLQKYNELYNNDEKKEMLNKKSNRLYKIRADIEAALNEYKSTDNKESLKASVRIYINELIPEVDCYKRLQYDIEEMIINETSQGIINVLNQREIDDAKKETLFKDSPAVIKYVI